MAAERFSSDVLEMFYGPIPRRENTQLPEPLNEVEPLCGKSCVGEYRVKHYPYLERRDNHKVRSLSKL